MNESVRVVGGDLGFGRGAESRAMVRWIAASVALALSACGTNERERDASPPSAPTAPIGALRAPLVSQLVLEASGDTFVRSLTPDQNLGGDTRLSLQALGKHRSLLFFDAPAIGALVGVGQLVSARIELSLASTGTNWGPGRPIAIHRLGQASAEYSATWACAADSNVSNFSADCSGATAWSMNATAPASQPWVSPATASAIITNGQTGVVTFDVTADVAAILAGTSPGHGWLVKKVEEIQAGSLEFASREQGPAPRLVLEVEGAPPSGNPPGPVTGSATVLAHRDTELHHLLPNQNFGSDNTLRIQALGKNRALIGFDGPAVLAALGGPLVKARLRLPIATAFGNWGPDRALGVHRVRRPWTELGATWNCAVDANPANFVADCTGDSAWSMAGPAEELAWLNPPTDTVLVESGQTGALELDVTRDVACALAGHAPLQGWLVKKAMESQSGRIDLHSREAAQAPSILLEWTDTNGVIVSPAECAVNTTPDGCTPTASEDTTCNSVDEDCDGMADDDFVVTASSCGVGACAATGQVSCVSGQAIDDCSPSAPAPNDAVCNGIDDDCDAIVDEDYAPITTTCGVGACSSTGETSCVLGDEVDSCQSGTPATDDATCNAEDDDCDGIQDENYSPQSTSCGIGACAASGWTSCVAGQESDSCTTGAPAAADATCNGVDEDCDGTADEDFAALTTSCGVGACSATGTTSCVAGQLVDGCTPGTPAAADATCNGVDEDCDGTADEDFAGISTSCGVGACNATGSTSCVSGQVVNNCTPGEPAASDATCNLSDDDCNGQVDEDYAPVTTSCGVGGCASSGSTSCVLGAVVDNCQPGTPAPADTTCNGVDEDCDGTADEEFVPLCAGSAVQSCVGGVLQERDCLDDDVCNGVETCANAACVAGTPLQLEDQNTCTTDSCDPLLGVRHEPVMDRECDFDACTPGACDGLGMCQRAPAPVADDGDPCTLTLCDPATGRTQVTCEPIDESRVTTIFDAMDWIYTGSQPVQSGVAPGTIERRRAALLRGEVRDRSGAPLGGVQIRVAGHAELGSTRSQANGSFDMVVNAGGQLTLEFAMPGRLGAQRSLNVLWNEIARVPTVILIEPDPIVTEVDLTQTATPFQVATSSVQIDSDGSRQATLLFPAGTEAVMIGADGTAVQLETLHVRATEFTVGESGPDAMPGPLPFTSGYTYAVEFNADEAVQAGARSIEFSKPLIGYVDNFLGFPAGTVVPVGTYDNEQHRWIPHESGIVLDIVSIGPGGADVDVTGDGIADTGAALESRGIDSDELAQLATLKQPGESVWRIDVPHFTQPYDGNWPFGPPPDADEPPGPDRDGPGDPDDDPNDPDEPEGPEASGPETDDPCRKTGSIIECETMTLRESLPLAGTPYSLEYASNRAPARRDLFRLPIRISRDQVPSSLLGIDLDIEIAGRHFSESFPAAANQYHVFEWDGLDAYGRRIKGQQTAKVRLSYAYRGSYQTAGKFGDYGSGVAISGVRTRQEIFLTRQWEEKLGAWEVPGFGGWSVDVHHAYDANSGAIYLGDGRRQLASQRSTVLARVATAVGSSTFGRLGAVGPDGSMYFVIDIGWLYRRTPDGVMTRLAENAGDLRFGDIALAPDGTLYLVESFRHRIYKLDPQGTLSHFAGTGVAGFSGDGGPATAAQLNDPKGIALDAEGTLYVADSLNRRVRRIGADGVIRTIAGTGSGLASDERDGVLATQSAVMFPTNVLVAPDGTLYVADSLNHRLYEVAPSGIINRIVATANPISTGRVYADGVPGRESPVYAINSLGMGAGDQLLFAGFMYHEPSNRTEGVFALSADKRVFRVVGGSQLDGINQFYYKGAPPRGFFVGNSTFTNPSIRLENGPEGLYISMGRSAVDRLAPPPPTLSTVLPGDLLVASDSVAEVYVFDATGRHKETRHLGTGAVWRQFFYDGRGLLVEIRDSDGNPTLIERDSSGNPSAIQGPYAHRTVLTLDEHGYLSKVVDPTGAATLLENSSRGLLESITDARGATTSMQYDSLGRLTRELQPSGGEQQLLAFGNTSKWQLDFVTAEGRATRYRIDRIAQGEIFTSTFPDLTSSSTRHDRNAARWVTTASDGTVISVRETSDARFGLARAMRETILQLPSSLSYKVERTRTVSGSTVAQNPFAYANETSNVVINGNTWRETYTPSTRTRTFLSPESRQVTLREDAVGRVTQLTVPGRQPVNYVYDADGRLETMTEGARITRLAYGSSGASAGYLESVTNALGERITVGRDGRGRPIAESYADNAQTSFGWDDNDNLLTVVPPGRPAHGQTYTDMDELESSIPPVVPGVPDPVTTYEYDLDGDVTREIRPDGSILTTAYDSTGRLESLTMPTGTVTYAYYPNTICTGCAPGRLMNVSGPSAISVDTEYDGQLVIGNTWSGDVQGGLRWAHDNNFRIVTETVSGANADLTLKFGYDRDGLQTCASPTSCTTPGADALRFTYNGAGQPNTTTLGNASQSYTYNAFGEVARVDATYAGSPLLSIVYDAAAHPRDALGRIHVKTETVAGLTTSWQYAYDARSRLASVTKDGVLTSQYGYDDNGNRLSVTRADGTLQAVYDNQDRLMSLGPLAFAYRESGELKNKLDTSSGALTSYVYDALGNLIAVTLPDEREITYVVDGRGRRMGKSVDGVLVQALLYRDQLRVAAELNAAGEVVSQFIYTGVAQSPDAMASGGQLYRFIKDQVGSVRLVVNAASGEIAQSIQYDEFGVVLEDTNPGFQPFGFAGGLYDGDTGLVRFGARDYDPAAGRWTAKDPILFHGGTTNLYEYAYGDPINLVDPDGQSPAAAGRIARLVGTGLLRFGRKVKKVWQDLDFDGPSAGLKHGNGRVCQMRYKKKPVVRLDYHPYPGTEGESRLHGHTGSGEGQHIPLDPRDLYDWFTK